jgi:hypothetical protein
MATSSNPFGSSNSGQFGSGFSSSQQTFGYSSPTPTGFGSTQSLTPTTFGSSQSLTPTGFGQTPSFGQSLNPPVFGSTQSTNPLSYFGSTSTTFGQSLNSPPPFGSTQSVSPSNQFGASQPTFTFRSTPSDQLGVITFGSASSDTNPQVPTARPCKHLLMFLTNTQLKELIVNKFPEVPASKYRIKEQMAEKLVEEGLRWNDLKLEHFKEISIAVNHGYVNA